MDQSLKNWNIWENKLDSDTIYADPVADDYKNASDAISFIQQYIGSGFKSDSFYRDNINRIKTNEKHGEHLYYDSEGTTSFEPVSGMSVKDFEDYDKMEDPGLLPNHLKSYQEKMKLGLVQNHSAKGQTNLNI